MIFLLFFFGAVFLNLFVIFIFEVVVGQLNVLDQFVCWFEGLRAMREPIGLRLLLHLLRDILILQIANILIVIFNDMGDILLKDSGQFLVVLIILAEHDYFVAVLVFFVESLEELSVLVEVDFILQKVDIQIKMAEVHFFDGLDHLGVLVVIVFILHQVVPEQLRSHHLSQILTFNLILQETSHHFVNSILSGTTKLSIQHQFLLMIREQLQYLIIIYERLFISFSFQLYYKQWIDCLYICRQIYFTVQLYQVMVSCFCFNYRNKVQCSIHYSWLSSPVLWIVRIASFSLLMIRLVVYYDRSQCCAQSFIYLTYYGFVLSITYFALVSIHLPLEKLLFKQSSVVKVIGECINMLYQATFAIECMLTILFWTLLAEGTDLWTFDNLGMHLIPFLLLLADFVLNSYSFPIRHLLLTFLVGAIYLIINQVHACTDQPVYPVYECGNVWLPIIAFAILGIVHSIGYGIWSKWRRNKCKPMTGFSEGQNTLLQT